MLSDDTVETYLRLYALLYADDTVIMAESPQQLQLALNSLEEYCLDNNLCVNISKTKILISQGEKSRISLCLLSMVFQLKLFIFTVYISLNFNYNG